MPVLPALGWSSPTTLLPLAGVSPELPWVGGPTRGLGVGGWCDPPGFKGTQRLFRVRTHTLKVRGLTGSLRWGVPLCLLWSLQINEGFPMAGTAIIGSLAEALNLLIFFPCLSISISLLSPTLSSVLPPISVWPSLFFVFLCLCVSLPVAASPISVALVLNLSALCLRFLCVSWLSVQDSGL